MGSDSDLPTMEDASLVLTELGLAHKMQIVSAHRTPDEMTKFAKEALGKGIQVIIAGAGGAAHLPGMIAAHTPLPVIGVPVPMGHLEGQDALLSIVQMPKGVPVATVAIGNAYNAGILAAQIIAAGGKTQDKKLIKILQKYKEGMRKKVLQKKIRKTSK
jgi:phosphoribosylaminoimidazole carboxylase PurE protein